MCSGVDCVGSARRPFHADSRAGRAHDTAGYHDRPGAVRRAALALTRPRSRGTVASRRGQQQPPPGVLLRSDRRGTVEDDRRGSDVATDVGSLLQVVIRRSRRPRRVESGHRLRRYGRDGAARKRAPGGRRLQVHGCREDVDARRPREDLDRRPDPRPPLELRRRIRGRARRSVRHRIRSAESSRPSTAGRRGEEFCSATTRPARSILSMDPKNPDVLYAGLWEVFTHPALAVERRAWQRPFQVNGRRRALDRDHEKPRPAETDLGQSGRFGVGRGSLSRLRDHRSGGRRRLPVRRCRRHVEDGQRGSPAPAARVLLHAHLRRPTGQGHALHPQHRDLSLDGRGQIDSRHPGAARRQPRPLDRSERSEADDQQQRRRSQRLRERRRDLDRSGLSNGAVLQRLHDGARSVSRLRRSAGQQHGLRARAPGPASCTRSAEERVATLRRTRRTRTCSTPEATAGS